jgi:hypothetical protein
MTIIVLRGLAPWLVALHPASVAITSTKPATIVLLIIPCSFPILPLSARPAAGRRVFGGRSRAADQTTAGLHKGAAVCVARLFQ